jgi:hypothetical protein
VEQLMKQLKFILVALLLFPALVFGGEKDEEYLKQFMIPRAQALLLRIAQTNCLPLTTNQVQSYKVDYYDDGWLGKMQLTNGWGISFFTDTRETNESITQAPRELEATYLKETMIPLAREFLLRIGLTNNLPFTTNQVQKYRMSYFYYCPGCQADMRLTNGLVFSFFTKTNKSEVWVFKNTNVKTYLELDNPPKEKIKALQALNLRNKLNQKSAEALAKKYFKLLGHKEENFHPLDFFPSEGARGYWVSAPEMPPANERLLPYYGFTWYRKDVKLEKIQNGEEGSISKVMIEVSGIDSSLVSYSKLGIEMPIGSDF